MSDDVVSLGEWQNAYNALRAESEAEIISLRAQLTAALESNRALVEIQTELRTQLSRAMTMLKNAVAESLRDKEKLTAAEAVLGEYLGTVKSNTKTMLAQLERIGLLESQLSAAAEREAEHQKTFERHAEIIGKQDRQIVAAEAQCAALAEALKPFADANFECDAADDESVDLFWGEDESWHIATITMGNLRCAKSALSQLPARSVAMGKVVEAAETINRHTVERAQLRAAQHGDHLYRDYMLAEDRKLDEAFQAYYEAALLLPLPQKDTDG
jgi:hypothetical protein